MAQSPLFFTPTPEIYPHAWDADADALFCVRLGEDAFRQASFLDKRMLTPTTPGRWYAWEEALAAAARLPETQAPHFIFHIGHVGSTLMSRLLGASSALFALREPSPLRTLAELQPELETPESRLSPDGYEGRRDALLKLWGRGWSSGQRALVKATSLASSLATVLLAKSQASRALFMFVQPQAYLASILGAPMSPAAIAAQAPVRLRRLHTAVGVPAWRLWRLSLGETIAMTWASDMTTLLAAATATPLQVRWIEFDRFLARPAEGLAHCFTHFGLAMPAGAVAAIVSGPLMRQYAKGPEHAYDAELRRQVLRAARTEQGAEIARGQAWLERAAREHPAIAKALAFSSAMSAEEV